MPNQPSRPLSWGRFTSALAVAALVTAPATLAAPGSLDLAPCHVAGSQEALRCGTLDVPENPDDPASRTLSLAVVVAPARGPEPAPDPLFILAGGPGQAATDLVRLATLAFDGVRAERDLVFVDQRGTGSSNALVCDLEAVLGSSVFGGSPDVSAALEVCLETLETHADLGLYTTFHAMPDLDRVREALGYETINLWGGSYGTRAAMVYQELFPERTRSLVLDGSAPFETRLPMFYARDAQRAWDLLVADCAADTACRDRYGDLQASFETLLATLDDEPATVQIPDPRSGEPLDLTVRGGDLANALRAILYSSQRAALVPFLIERALAGDYAPWVATTTQMTAATAKTMSLGMTFSVLCSEDHPRIDPEAALKATEGTFLGTEVLEVWRDACTLWPKATLPPGFDQLSESAVPALILSGEADPVVPPEWGEETLARFENGRHLTVPGTGHNTSHVGCIPDLIAEFLDTTDARGLEASCVEDVERPPFTLGYAGPAP